MTPKKYKLTQDGLKQLQEELDYRITTKREEAKNIMEEMKNAGDLRENDGYSLAKEDFQSNEIRIAEIEEILKNYELIDENSASSRVDVGSTVEIEVEGNKSTLMIVGDSEANPLENKISHHSPIGQALVGKKAGDAVKVTLPRGDVEYKIVKIS